MLKSFTKFSYFIGNITSILQITKIQLKLPENDSFFDVYARSSLALPLADEELKNCQFDRAKSAYPSLCCPTSHARYLASRPSARLRD